MMVHILFCLKILMCCIANPIQFAHASNDHPSSSPEEYHKHDRIIFPNDLIYGSPTPKSQLWWNSVTSSWVRPTNSLPKSRYLLQNESWKVKKFYKMVQLGCGNNNIKSNRNKRSVIGPSSNSVIGNHPWFVAIGILIANGNINWICGGSVISNRWVLTSAHCVYSMDRRRIRLYVGGSELNGGRNGIKKISEYVTHPEYHGGSHYDVRNNVALIKASNPLETTPICLQPAEHRVWPKVDFFALIIGYGYGLLGGPHTEALRERRVKIISKSECARFYGDLIKNSTDLYCVKDKRKSDSTKFVFDACQGDFGGVMVRFVSENNSIQYNIIGLQTASMGCDHQTYPGIYTNMKDHIDWIINTIVY